MYRLRTNPLAVLPTATDRPRLVLIGYDPAYVDSFTAADVRAAEASRISSVRDAIADIPSPAEASVLPYRSSVELSAYARALRVGPPRQLGGTRGRSLRRSGLVSGVARTLHSEEVVERFGRMAGGERDPISRYPRLHWDRPAPVLRAGTGRDHGSFQAARPVHPQEPRVISVREAARLQGFPDWFQFSGTKWHSHRMIGNSVSPQLGRGVLALIHQRLADVDEAVLAGS